MLTQKSSARPAAIFRIRALIWPNRSQGRAAQSHAVKRIAVLGATGSIGRQTLDVAKALSDRLQVVAMTANTQDHALVAAAAEHGVSRLALMDEDAAARAQLPGGVQAVCDIATAEDVDVVVVAVAGVIGLLPTLAAIRAGKAIALASKEVLVAAGEVVMPLVAKHGVTMTPIDSEHSAVFQCLLGSTPDQVAKVTLTASGGPFRGWTSDRLASVAPEDALNHPTWRMGGKITVDSATLMNKGLEMIEAHWLFGLAMDQVDFVVHPQSIVHSFVTFNDGSALAQLGWPDMRLPIQYALLHPERVPAGMRPWNPVASGDLTFEPPDLATFRCPGLARAAAEAGGTMPSVMNAANEHAANAFLRGECGFLQIADAVEAAMSAHENSAADLDAVIEADRWARERTARFLRSE
jgi:1-deoxy-D-xylulose-5-phosphate reductoisomerase